MKAAETTLSYAGFYGATFEEFIDIAQSLGFGAVQLIPDQTPNLLSEFDEGRVNELRKKLATAKLGLSVHSVFYDINLVSVVPEVQSAALKIVESCVALCVALGGSGVTVHPGYMFPGWRSTQWQSDVFWQSAKRGMMAIDDICARYNSYIFIENGSYFVSDRSTTKKTPLHIGITVKELERLFEGTSSSVGLCLDIGKALVSEIDLFELVEKLSERVGQVQIGGAASIQIVRELNLPRNPEIVFEGGRDAAVAYAAL